MTPQSIVESLKGGEFPSFLFALGSVATFFSLMLFNSLPSDQVFIGIPFLALAFFFGLYVKSEGTRQIPLRLVTPLVAAPIYLFCNAILVSYWPWLSIWVAVCLVFLSLGFFAAFNVGRLSISGIVFSFIFVNCINAGVIIWLALSGMYRPSGFVVDPNLAANLLAVALLSSAYISGGRNKAWLCMIQLFLGVALFLTMSRAAVYALGGAIILFVILSQLRSVQWVRPVLALGVTLAGAFLVADLVSSEQPQTASFAMSARPESWQDRLEMWSSAWQMFVQEPIWGTGLGSFALRYPALRPGSETTTLGYFAHNDYLQLLLELGVVGFVVWLALPIMFLGFIFLGYLKLGKPESSYRLSAFLISVSALVAVHSAVNFVLYHPLINIYLGAIFGVALRESAVLSYENGKKCKAMSSRFAAKAIFLIFFCAVTASFVVDVYARKLIESANNADSGFDLESEVYYELLPLMYFSPLNVEIKNKLVESQMNTAINLHPSKVGEELIKKTIKEVEQNAWLQWGNCSMSVDAARGLWLEDKKLAIKALEALLVKAPNCIRGRITLAEAHLAKSDYSSAIRVLNAGVDRFSFRENTGRGPVVLLSTLARAYRSSGELGSALAIEAYVEEFERGQNLKGDVRLRRIFDW